MQDSIRRDKTRQHTRQDKTTQHNTRQHRTTTRQDHHKTITRKDQHKTRPTQDKTITRQDYHKTNQTRPDRTRPDQPTRQHKTTQTAQESRRQHQTKQTVTFCISKIQADRSSKKTSQTGGLGIGQGEQDDHRQGNQRQRDRQTGQAGKGERRPVSEAIFLELGQAIARLESSRAESDSLSLSLGSAR
jgi:hypothetical protein